MKKLVVLALCLALLGACAGVGVQEEPATGESTVQVTTTEETTTQVIVTPSSYRDAPEAYWPVLDEFYRVIYSVRRGDEGTIWRYWDPGAFSRCSWDEGDLGYAVVDINRDGTPELVLLGFAQWPVSGDWSDPEAEFYSRPEMIAMYTLYDSEPVQLRSWSRRCQRTLTADGTLWESTPTGAGSRSMGSHMLESNSLKFTELTWTYTDIRSEILLCYRNADGEGERIITEDEWRTLGDRYQNPPSPMQFNFIPIEQ